MSNILELRYPGLSPFFSVDEDVHTIIPFCTFGYGYSFPSVEICDYLEMLNVYEPLERLKITYCILRDSGVPGYLILSEFERILLNEEDPLHKNVKEIVNSVHEVSLYLDEHYTSLPEIKVERKSHYRRNFTKYVTTAVIGLIIYKIIRA